MSNLRLQSGDLLFVHIEHKRIFIQRQGQRIQFDKERERRILGAIKPEGYHWETIADLLAAMAGFSLERRHDLYQQFPNYFIREFVTLG
jgi:hypothetical protein